MNNSGNDTVTIEYPDNWPGPEAGTTATVDVGASPAAPGSPAAGRGAPTGPPAVVSSGRTPAKPARTGPTPATTKGGQGIPKEVKPFVHGDKVDLIGIADKFNSTGDQNILTAARQVGIQDQDFEAATKFARDHIKVGNKDYIPVDTWNKLPSNIQNTIRDKGIKAGLAQVDRENYAAAQRNEDVEAINKEAERELQKLRAATETEHQKRIEKVYTKARTIPEPSPHDTVAERQAIIKARVNRTLDAYGEVAEKGSLPAKITVRMIPVVGTGWEVREALKDGNITSKEWVWIGFGAAADVASLASIGVAAGVGARAAAGLGRGARVAAAARAAGRATVAELTAPIRVIAHPVETAKGALKAVEAITRLKRVPVVAGEVATATVRLPVKAFKGGEAEAMTVRDIGALSAMREGKFVTNVGDTTLKLPPARLQSIGEPIAVHATPDIRPFLEGTTVAAGREGGLFVAPNLHTRFTAASAFGDMPEGGIRGGLIIRDPDILSKIKPSGKIYAKTAEVEGVIPGGVELPKPSQTLIMRSPGAAGQGDKLTLLVYGKPYNAAELAKLKFMAAGDTLKGIINPPASIKGVDLAKEYDKLNDIRKEADELIAEAGKLKKAGKAAEAAAKQKRAEALIAEASRMARRLSAPAVSTQAGNVRLAFATTAGDTPVSRLNTLEGSRNTEVLLTRQQVEAISDSRLNYETVADANRDIARLVESVRENPIRKGRRAAPEVRDARGRPQVKDARGRPTVEARDARGRPEVKDARGRPTVEARGARGRPEVKDARGRPTVEARDARGRPIVEARDARGRAKATEPTRLRGFIKGMTDKEKREVIKEAGGAICRRQGELGGKSIWHVWKYPYKDESDYTTLRGKPPAGAKLIKGIGSAYKSSVRLYGKAPEKDTTVDMGAMDTTLTTQGDVKFTPDPKQLTTGDFSISKRVPFPITRTKYPKIPKLR